MEKRLLVVVLSVMVICGVQAKYTKITTEHSFNATLDKNELVVVMFYRDEKEMKGQLSNFKSAASGEKNAAFAAVNLDKSDVSELGSLYNVEKTPVFMLFRNGTVFKKGTGTVLMGEQSSSAIRQFVRENFGKYLSRIRTRKRREAEANRPSVSFGIGYGYPYDPYYGPYYGYYGYPYYYGRPAFSFGIGF